MAVDFRAKQAEFAGYIRDPGQNLPPADVDPARMAMYRELFFNNINSFLSGNFPVLRSLYDDAQWLALAQDFYSRHSSRTPHFSEIAEEFLDYLQNERNQSGDYPFLLELAHYEWVEMALAIAKDEPVFGDGEFVNDVVNRRVALSTLAWPLVYQFPVQLISSAFLPEVAAEQPTYLIVYRDAADEVHFMQTTPLTFRLLQIIEENNGVTGEAALATLRQEFIQLDAQTLLGFGRQTLQELAAKGIIVPSSGGD